MRRKLEYYKLPEELLNPELWNPILIENVPFDKQLEFSRLKDAIYLYLTSEEQVSSILTKFNLSKKRFYSVLDRCLQMKNEYEIYQYEGILNRSNKKYERISYDSVTDKSHVGAFRQLLLNYPSLEQSIGDTHFRRNKKKSTRMLRITQYELFIEELRTLGVKDFEYPFNTSDKAKRSFYNYLKKLDADNYEESMKKEGNEAYQRSKENREPVSLLPQVTRPYAEVELDGHWLDAEFVVTATDINGDTFQVEVIRPWLLVIIDRATRCILGYHLTTSRNYNSQDVLSCIHNAIHPWSPKSISIPGVKYLPDAGFPSGLLEEAEFGVFETLFMDNAKAHLAEQIQGKLTQGLGVSLCFGKVAGPTCRAIVERFFGTLEDSFIHRLPSTTGSNPNDKKRANNPEEAAESYEITFEALKEIMDVVVANYNATPSLGSMGHAPIHLMKKRFDKGFIVGKLSEDKRNSQLFFAITYDRKVVANNQAGNYIHINFCNAKYTGIKLSKSKGMIGKSLTVVIDPKDITSVMTFTETGHFFEKLYAEKRWRKIPHTMEDRKLIHRALKDRRFKVGTQDDAVTKYVDYIRQNKDMNKKEKSLATRTMIYRRAEVLDFPLDSKSSAEQESIEEMIQKEKKKISQQDIFRDTRQFRNVTID